MKKSFIYILLLFGFISGGQNIQVDSQSFTPQQLIEDILIDSDCIDNVVVSNVIGGNFNNTDQSYGYFDATGTDFPFQSGVVLSTGRLNNVPGPNTSLSDDDAPNWIGDPDLEFVLQEMNTLNATIIEFDFTSIATQISFRYIFASEEYQEGNPNTCRFSDLFGFLIRPINEEGYTNIAVVPNTQTPVKVTTVHPEIPNACQAENEFYFESWNGPNVPINFNGQTKVLTATADVVPNETYHVKLLIADEQNFRFDSAVFLEAGSFQLSTDLGPNRLISTNNPLCENDTLTLDASQTNANSFKWFKDGVEQTTETNATYIVTEEGTYNVEVTLDNNCISYGEVLIEYLPNPVVSDSVLIECDQDQDGLTLYNLFDVEPLVTNNDNSVFISDFFLNENDATLGINPIIGANIFENTTPFQTVFARVDNQARCFSIAEVELQISNNVLNISTLQACDGEENDGFTTFDLSQIASNIGDQIPAGATVQFFETELEAFQNTNALSTNFENTIPNEQLIFVKVENNNQCYSISSAQLEVLPSPMLEPDEELTYCLNFFPETIRLFASNNSDIPEDHTYEWFLDGLPLELTTSSIDINTVGNYSVTVFAPNGCFTSRNISVVPSNIATLENVIIRDGTSNNTIIIEVSGEGDYQFSIDVLGDAFQPDNVFSNVPGGFHTISIVDMNGCGIIQEAISVLAFPKYFTPNGDSFHDVWHVYGINANASVGLDVKIFDRYGKLLKQLNQFSNGWDGTFNGQNLPTDDYWFTASFANGRTFTGHFTLKR